MVGGIIGLILGLLAGTVIAIPAVGGFVLLFVVPAGVGALVGYPFFAAIAYLTRSHEQLILPIQAAAGAATAVALTYLLLFMICDGSSSPTCPKASVSDIVFSVWSGIGAYLGLCHALGMRFVSIKQDR